MNQARHTALHASRLEMLGDYEAVLRYLRLARLARAHGDHEVAAYRLSQALDARRAWHRSRRPVLQHFHGRRR